MSNRFFNLNRFHQTAKLWSALSAKTITPSISLHAIVTFVVFSLATCSAFAQSESKTAKPDDSKKATSATELDKDKKPLSASEAEFKRRMKALEESLEKENRPARPDFAKPAAKRNGAITFDDIKFEMEKGEKFNRKMLTDDITDLVGKRISIKGYIRPNNKNKGLKKFVFVRDDKECCFGPGAALFDCVLVSLDKGKESDFTVRPITVEGEFFLKEFNGPDRRVWAVYRMKNCRVVK